jgi:hypothetical protein
MRQAFVIMVTCLGVEILVISVPLDSYVVIMI